MKYVEKSIREIRQKIGYPEPLYPSDGLASIGMNDPRMLAKLEERTAIFKKLLSTEDLESRDITSMGDIQIANFEALYARTFEQTYMERGTFHIDDSQPISGWNAEAELNVYDERWNLLHGLRVLAAHFYVKQERISTEAGQIACIFATEEGYHDLEFTRLGNEYRLAYHTVSAPDGQHTSEGLWKSQFSTLPKPDGRILSVLDVLPLPQEARLFLLTPMKQAIIQHSG